MKKAFLLEVFLSNAQSASFQRGNVYRPGATPTAVEKFQEDFHKRLRQLEQRYAHGVTEEEHCQTIQGFADELSQAHPEALANGRLRIGTAQKAINLFLKYLWSADLIKKEPPHCPVDGIILWHIKSDVKWTRLVNMEEYRSVIESLKKRASPRSLAQWELEVWSEISRRGSDKAPC